MRTETLQSVLRKRVHAFVGATAVVAVLWLLAVLAVNAFGSSPPLGDREGLLPKGVARLPGGLLREAQRNGGVRLVLLHDTGGTPSDFMAWHTVVQCLILVTLAALVVAGLDRLRRKMRKSQRVRTVRSGGTGPLG
jgi:hypothetical protein